MAKLTTSRQLREISASYNLGLSNSDVDSYLGLMPGVMASHDGLDQLVEPALRV